MKIKSISTKTFLIFLASILLIVGISWFIQTNFLEKYYIDKKIEAMEEHARSLENALNTMSLEEVQLFIQDIAEKNGGRVMVMSKEGELLLYSRQGNFSKGMMGAGEIWKKLKAQGEYAYRKVSHGGFGRGGNGEWIIYGKLTKGGMGIMIQSPLQSIQETVVITQRFYVYIFSIAILFAILLAFVFSRMVTQPLVKLNKLVKQMGDLNFHIRYKEKREDEIGELGTTFNYLVEKLDKTIGALKVELEKEKNLDKMRKQFIARVSHELQTPTAIIHGYAEGLKDGVVTEKEEIDFYCDVIQDETNKLSSMVKELLDLSQLESGTFAVKLNPFDFTNLIEEIYGKYKLLAEERGRKLTLIHPPQDIWVLGDEHRIEQVLINFIQNAANHGKEQGEIKLILESQGTDLRIGVQNEGNNIPEEEIPYIWDSFYKVKNKEEQKGTGLGLAIAKSILQQHHSPFGVKNIEDGVEFFFTLKQVENSQEI
ncbi:HAMP domain-containing sensor histidine kinase [Clostridiaceae bacterium 35-E11]